MTFTQLEVFATLARLGSFSRAAQALGITQSAVSHALRSLERELGVSLFWRDRAAAELTPAGERLLARAHEMNQMREAMLQDACNARGLSEGLLRIASFGATSSLRILPELLSRFGQEHPGIQVHVDEDDDATVLRWLEERRVEIGFVTLPDERFETWPVLEDEYMVLLPSSHPLAAKASLDAADLQGQPFVLAGAGCQDVILGALQSIGAQPDIRYRFSQLLSILGFVRQGLAVSMAARMALPDEPEGVVYRPLKPAIPRRVGLAVRDPQRLSPAAAAFMAMARRVYPG
ncbi:LysR family transcriptional regulator [Paucibacter sp. APW11]|uniref:LysR family transcriptional regulator n=1 Tax=Roseateles aquae TaxID=3077235 RepID=A0ABU3PBT3_9BURK|nr:LysR family transcriptional regulator [Paucibacter sp. APW11]MDT8999995.1 LysR family transcriptional regulator [Paucibacter sp. APW11]